MKIADLDDYDFEELLSQAEGEACSEWEVNFTSDLREKYAQYGDEMFISEAQIAKLRTIAKDD